MTQAATREHEVNEDEQRKIVAEAAKAAAEREAEDRRFNALFSWDDEQRRRSLLPLPEVRHFDAIVMEARSRFAALSHDEREAYLKAQEAMTPAEREAAAREARDAPTPQHVYSELLAELTYIKVSNLPIPDSVFNQLVSLVKTYNAEPPAGGVLATEGTRRHRAAA